MTMRCNVCCCSCVVYQLTDICIMCISLCGYVSIYLRSVSMLHKPDRSPSFWSTKMIREGEKRSRAAAIILRLRTRRCSRADNGRECVVSLLEREFALLRAVPVVFGRQIDVTEPNPNISTTHAAAASRKKEKKHPSIKTQVAGPIVQRRWAFAQCSDIQSILPVPYQTKRRASPDAGWMMQSSATTTAEQTGLRCVCIQVEPKSKRPTLKKEEMEKGQVSVCKNMWIRVPAGNGNSWRTGLDGGADDKKACRQGSKVKRWQEPKDNKQRQSGGGVSKRFKKRQTETLPLRTRLGKKRQKRSKHKRRIGRRMRAKAQTRRGGTNVHQKAIRRRQWKCLVALSGLGVLTRRRESFCSK
ncbi:hypothetical protein IWX90DRAFT_124295 [Phyllosticta citrichinensis]|uniref:Uncharacterized protein n=1 Tax=Phyllosticta citrichinensis TaxID=1130410 RepID=A0ABR1Y3Y4_9PEZI